MPTIRLKSFYNELHLKLGELHNIQEARQIALIVLEEVISIQMKDILSGKSMFIPKNKEAQLEKILDRLLKNEPVQYVLGKTYFYDRSFQVNPAVLIPRQETEELVFKIVADHQHLHQLEILDIGTGSGCIAVTLVLELPRSQVWALDIDSRAIKTAMINADSLNARVNNFNFDILSKQSLPGMYDVIVSNPPYVTESEKNTLHKQVIDYEPHTALFVPDEDPLVFYRHIAKKSLDSLRQGGHLYFEINQQFAVQTADLLTGFGYENVAIYNDLNDKPRIVCATKP